MLFSNRKNTTFLLFSNLFLVDFLLFSNFFTKIGEWIATGLHDDCKISLHPL